MTYEVQAGDTLSSIAKRNNVSVAALLAVNTQIRDANQICVRQRIVIPPPVRPAPAFPTPLSTIPPDGPSSYADFLKQDLNLTAAPPVPRLAWGKGRSEAFKRRVVEIAEKLGCDPNHLMAAMAFETGGSFSPRQRCLGKGGKTISNAVGLIQFMPDTANGLGTSTSALANMTAEAQLDYVYLHFRPFKGKLKTLSDVYMAILYPRAVGKP